MTLSDFDTFSLEQQVSVVILALIGMVILWIAWKWVRLSWLLARVNHKRRKANRLMAKRMDRSWPL